jgi:hypothetical protein
VQSHDYQIHLAEGKGGSFVWVLAVPIVYRARLIDQFECQSFEMRSLRQFQRVRGLLSLLSATYSCSSAASCRNKIANLL